MAVKDTTDTKQLADAAETPPFTAVEVRTVRNRRAGSGPHPLIGEVLGRYRVTELVGRGGMAEVFRAEHVLIGGQFAIKVLLPSFSRKRRIRRLFTEARITASLEHPGIVKTFDFGRSASGRVYLVMKYLQGQTLQARADRLKRIPVAAALEYARQITSALGAAHRAGVIHRDLKPSNIFLVKDADFPGGERIRILDFGIAKDSMTREDGQITQIGAIVGTPHYMSPEQCQAHSDVDHRTDLYAVGCILYRMLTGRTIFTATDSRDILICHRTTRPTEPREIEAAIPKEVNALIMRLVAKKPDDRFASASELLAQINRIKRSLYGTEDEFADTITSSLSDLIETNKLPHVILPGNFPTKTIEDSTLADHSAVVLEPKNRPARISWRYLLAAATLASMAVVVAFMFADVVSPQSQSSSSAVTAAVAETETEPMEEEIVRIAVESDPPGADVYQMPQSVRIGSTPLAIERPAFTGELVLIVKKNGYEDSRLVAPADRSGSYREMLTAVEIIAVDKPLAVKEPEPTRKRRRRSARSARRGGERGGESADKEQKSPQPPASSISDNVTLDPFRQ